MGTGPSTREDHTWTVDGNGTAAYLFGGRDGDDISNELWVFDLQSDEWTIATPSGPGPDARFGHTATWVPDFGLVIWSGQAGSTFFDDIWAYEPTAGAWRELPSLGDLPPARYGSCASLGPDGRLWISHGFTDTGRFDDTRAYDFGTGEWTDETPDGDRPVQRCLHDCYWSSGDTLILYGGQTNGVPALGDLWTYDPATSAWQEGPQPAAAPRQLYSLAVADGVGIVFGGGAENGGYLDDTWLINHLIPEMSEQPFQTRPPARSGATLIPAGGSRYLLFGGRNEDGALSDMWELNGFFSTRP
ncbi:MAG TPA: kelch repeat-containing protein [Candidatus Limnocylindrales bacterium]|nr:kelch repeat-containing protein [Candidatus Limnocylindrales bacterium]